MGLVFFKQPFLMIMVGLLLLALFILFLHVFNEKRLRRDFVVISLIFCSSAFMFYFLWGAPIDVIQFQALRKIENKLLILTQDKSLTFEKIDKNLHQLEKEIAFSHVALARLGELYITLGLFDQSIQVFTQATALHSDNIEYWIQWIYSHSLRHQGKLPHNVKQKALELIEKEPEQKILLNLLAIDDYFQGNYQEAIDRWEFILKNDKNLTDERRLTLQQAINSSYKALGHLDSADKPFALNVNVSLSPKLQQNVLANESVFVFVKSATGSSIPLTVIRKKAHELPFTVNLTKTPQMVPGQSLSQGKEIIVFAKISKSGDPLNKKGDLQGMSHKIVLNSEMNSVLLEINEVQS